MQTHGNGRFTPYRMAKGQLVLVLQDTMQSTEYTELVMTVVNGLEFRNYSRPVLRVKGCAEVPASLFTLVPFVPCCARVFVRVSVCVLVCRWSRLVSPHTVSRMLLRASYFPALIRAAWTAGAASCKVVLPTCPPQNKAPRAEYLKRPQ